MDTLKLMPEAMLRLRRWRAIAAQRGFTLIELMIVVAVIAILAAVAYPAYQDSVWKGRRGEGKAAIFRALQSEERYYTSNNTYVQVPSASAVGFSMPVFSSDTPSKAVYSIAADVCPAPAPTTIDQCVQVTATPIAGPDPKCGPLAVDSRGKKPPIRSRTRNAGKGDDVKTLARGFTLIELLVVVVLIAIMLAIAVPSFASFIANYRVTTAMNDFLQGVTMTRLEALKRGRFVDMVPKTAGDWKSGWRIIIDTAVAPVVPNHQWDAGEEIIFEHDALPTSITVSDPTSSVPPAGLAYVAFDGTGYPRVHGGSGGALTGGVVMVDNTASTPTIPHALCLAPFGRPRLFTQPTGVPDCSNG